MCPEMQLAQTKFLKGKSQSNKVNYCPVNAGQTSCNLVNVGNKKSQSTLLTCGGEERCPEVSRPNQMKREIYV